VATQPILLATRSRDKAREIRQILDAASGSRIVTLDEIGLAATPEEDGIEVFDSFLDNAHAKADFFLRRSGLSTIADDSGICVAALHNAPGVRSRRFAPAAAGASGAAADRLNNEHLLQQLRGVPAPERAAYYACAAVLHRPDQYRTAALGTCSGFILEQPRGSHGFGYDPLFLLPAAGLSFGEIDPALKNRVSHRARAFRALAAAL
jgi:XTP/dITP diphosphohydrolase